MEIMDAVAAAIFRYFPLGLVLFVPPVYLRLTTPTWSELQRLGSSRALRSSYVWLVLVPIAVRLIDQVNDVIHVEVFGATIPVTMKLPFSWQTFFFAALAISAGNAIYQWRCPYLISAFSGFQDFKASGRGFDQIKTFQERYLPLAQKVAQLTGEPKDVEEKATLSLGNALSNSHQHQYNPGSNNTTQFEWFMAGISKSFWAARDGTDYVYPSYRKACGALYAVGLALLICVGLQNVWFVLRYVIK